MIAEGAAILVLEALDTAVQRGAVLVQARGLGLRVVITAHDVEAFKAGLSVPLFVRWAYRCAHRVIAHSQIARRELVHELGIADGKIDVILHRFSKRTQIRIEIFGIVAFLLLSADRWKHGAPTGTTKPAPLDAVDLHHVSGGSGEP